MENTVEKMVNSKEQVLLTKKDINKSFYRWYFDAEVANCYERQQGVAVYRQRGIEWSTAQTFELF